MSTENATCTRSQLEGDHFKLCIQVLIGDFNVSIPYINGSDIGLNYTNKEGKPVLTEFNYGHHYLDYLNEQSKVDFFIMKSEEIIPLFEKSGLDYHVFVVILFAEHLYIQSFRNDQELSDPIQTEAQFDELEKQGVKFDIPKIHPDDIHFYAKEKVYTPNAEVELNKNQTAFLEEITEEVDYVDHARQEMLELYIFVNNWKTPTEHPLTLKSGYKTMKLNNHRNWTSKALNDYFDKYLGINSVEEAQDDLAFNYSKKTGRKVNNKFQTLMIYGIDNLYRKVTKSDEITNQQCEFIRDYLKHLYMPITQDSFDDPDDIKNIRSRIRYLRKNGCSETWGLPSSHLETITKLYTTQTGGK